MIRSKKELSFYIAADRIMRGLPPFPNLRDRIREFLFHDDIACYLKSMRMIAYYEDNQKICGGGIIIIDYALNGLE